jgi:hypothetical protein
MKSLRISFMLLLSLQVGVSAGAAQVSLHEVVRTARGITSTRAWANLMERRTLTIAKLALSAREPAVGTRAGTATALTVTPDGRRGANGTTTAVLRARPCRIARAAGT